MSELITLIEIDQPFCTRTYGESPCSATLGVTGTAKCYNTRSTCQDPANYQAEDLTLRFCKTSQQLQDYGYCVPSVQSVSMTPMKINLGGMDQDSRAFGNRERVSISAVDLKSSDYLVDKYQSERDSGGAGDVIDPYNSGTFWGKWISRNPFHEGYNLRVIQGTTEQSVAQMETRHYIIDRISGPSDGQVSIVAKDVFSRVESRKSKAPRASRGELRNGFSELHGNRFHLIPGGIGSIDYPTGEFWVAINGEAIRVQRDPGTDSIQILERGGLGTEAEDHEASDKVQVILAYESERAHVIVADLLVNYAGVDASLIDMNEWDAAMADRPELLTGYVAEPTAVETLIGEIAEQIGFTIWPSVTENKINLKVLTAGESPSVTVDDDAWMVQGSYAGRRMINQRVSQVWVYYGQRNPIESLDDPANYHSRRVFADLEAEGDEFYGQSSIKEIYSRWIPQFAGTFAATAGSRILSLFRDPPLRVSFNLHRTRDGQLSLAAPFELNTRDNQSETGANLPVNLVPIELVRSQERIEVLAQQLRFFTTPSDDRTLTIEGDTFNFNIRQAFEALFGAPNPGDEIVVQVFPNVTVGSVDPSVPAMETGGFPEGVILRIELASGARIIGAGGDAGDNQGGDGEDGGAGLLAEYGMTIDNLGTIAGGGGGGGGARDESSPLLAQAAGGGGAGVVAGTGANNGTDTTGGDGGFAQDSTGGVEPVTAQADGGDGGDLGQPGQDGSTILTPDGEGAGGKAGPAVDGGAAVSFTNEGALIGDVNVSETTELSPPAAVPQDVTLTSELTLSSTTDYAINLVLAFDDPGDTRIVSFEAEYRLGRHGSNWQPLYNALEARHEWPTAEVGQFQVRVRSVYPGGITSGWAYAQTTNLGTFDQLSAIGLEAPINPLLFITTDPESATADIRIEADYAEGSGAMPDRFILMYSAATNPRQLVVEEDNGADRLYLDADESVAGLFTMPVDSGSTDRVINYIRPQGVDINTVGGWWAAIDRQSAGFSEYRKVNQASSSQLTLGRGDAYDFIPQSGDTLHIAELDWADSRLPEFKLAYINGEIIRHRGIQLDDSGATDRYYLDVADRGAEGTTQAQHIPGDLLDYYPAPGPLTNIVEVPAGEFTVIDNQFVFSGTIPVDMPPNMGWASVTCSVARKASDDDSALYVRSFIVPLTIAGPV